MKKTCLSLLAIVLVVTTYAQDLYDIDNITEINIYFDDPNWDSTMDTYYANDQDELLWGSCEINGQQYDSVGVAYKGNSTYDANNAKNPLKIKLAEVYDQHYQHCQTLKLSNGFKDPSFVREVLSYEIGRKYMDMPLSNYAKVFINDNYYGLFVSSESINGDFMEKRFYCDDDNVRVKCNPAYGSGGSPSLEYLGVDSSLYYDSYEMKSDFGWQELVNLCYQIENNPSIIEQYLDVDAALWMLAYDNVLVNLDSYIGPIKQNYYLIQDDNGIFHPVIWDLNQSFASFTMLGGGPPGPPNLTDYTNLDLYFNSNDPTYPLLYKLLANSRYKKMYVAHVRTLVAENFSNGWYYTRGGELQNIVDAEVQNEPNGFYSHSEFITNLDASTGSGPGSVYGIKEIMEGRVNYYNGHTAFSYTVPVISSVTASPAVPQANDVVTFTADIQNANYAYLGYRSYKGDPFSKIEMFDDGMHGDGAAADGVWGVQLFIGASDLQYYIWAENNEAGKFSPVRAEHEFYELNLASGVVINELMASNNVTAADEYGEYNDWIEFYNNSASTVDLSGYLLSDDPLDVAKWSFPSGTSIGPGEYLIVWADNDGQAGLHTNFKLSSSGETLIFSDASGNAINTVQFPKVEDNGTYGRYPNGTGGFIPMYPTYNAENTYTAVSVPEEEQVELLIYPNPATDFINVKGLDNEGETIRIYNLQGQMVIEKSIQSGEVIDVSTLTAGAYVVQFVDAEVMKKVIVK